MAIFASYDQNKVSSFKDLSDLFECVRATNIAKRNNIRTVEQFAEMTNEQFEQLLTDRNCGLKTKKTYFEAFYYKIR